MDAIVYLAERNSGFTGTFGVFVDAARALTTSPHIVTTRLQLLCPEASSLDGKLKFSLWEIKSSPGSSP